MKVTRVLTISVITFFPPPPAFEHRTYDDDEVSTHSLPANEKNPASHFYFALLSYISSASLSFQPKKRY